MIHTFNSTGEAYDASQCRDDIKDGDVLTIPSEKVVGFLFKAWPIAVTPEPGEFHQLEPGTDITHLGAEAGMERWECYSKREWPEGFRVWYKYVRPEDPGQDYTESVKVALEVAAQF